MKRSIAVVVAVLGVVAAPAMAVAGAWGSPQWDVSLDIGLMTGDTTYQIGGLITDNAGGVYEVQFPLSELKWPLDIAVAFLGGSGRFGPLSVQARIGASLTDSPGEMEDSDWGVYYLDYGPPFRDDSLDIFSTSDATLSAAMFDLKVRYAFLDRPGFSLAGGIGLLYQDFSFEARGVDQYSPSWRDYGLTGDPFRFRGGPNQLGITYDVTYTVPYLEIAAGWKFGHRVTVDASLGYSPIAYAEDTDDHVLRGKLSEGSCDGSAVMANVGATVAFGRRFFGAVGLSYLNIDTDGTQVQSYYEDPSMIGYEATIDHTITSSQTSLYLRGGITF